MTEYIVYFTIDSIPQSYNTFYMDVALKFMEDMRKQRRNGLNVTHIVLSAENPNQVGQMGVDEIVDGKNPDGSDYTWSKAHRAGEERGAPFSIIDNRSNK